LLLLGENSCHAASSARSSAQPSRSTSRPLFFFQADDGIRDFHVTGVQTCALPIWRMGVALVAQAPEIASPTPILLAQAPTSQAKIGRASCRGRAQITGAGGAVRTGNPVRMISAEYAAAQRDSDARQGRAALAGVSH